MTEAELDEFIKENAGKTFKNCVIRTESEETTILANKKGEITTLKKKITGADSFSAQKNGGKNAGTAMNILSKSANRTKNYLIPEGTPVPFLGLLGIMTPEGKIISSKYDKFRQINRFLEFLDDILPAVTGQIKGRTLRIADFGCGKSYLTFAVHYFLTEIKKIDAEIIGLDLKRDVIEYCSRTAERLNLKGLSFDTGNIADYSYKNEPDIVITLHACDTATDYALDYAVKHGCRAILSVPCCQHELNAQLDENKKTLEGRKYRSSRIRTALEIRSYKGTFCVAGNRCAPRRISGKIRLFRTNPGIHRYGTHAEKPAYPRTEKKSVRRQAELQQYRGKITCRTAERKAKTKGTARNLTSFCNSIKQTTQGNQQFRPRHCSFA